MPRLDTATRNIVIGRLQAGESHNAVARLYNVHRSTISRLMQRYKQSDSTADRQRSVRPRIPSVAEVQSAAVSVKMAWTPDVLTLAQY